MISEPTYCTIDDVAYALDVPSQLDPTGTLMFTETSHPNAEQVTKMILANEDIIDRRLRRSWRENRVENYVATIRDYWGDINGWRFDYYAKGGYYVQLRKDVLPWDPEKGDKLEIRMYNNQWYDISNQYNQNGFGITVGQMGFWFDYPMGKLYIRTRQFQPRDNAIRISYRYGLEDGGDVPYGIQRLCSLLTANQVLNMQAFNIKVGAGADISGVREQIAKNWQDEMNQIWSSFQRSGSVHSMLR